MAEPAAPHGTTSTLPPPSVNGVTRSPPAPPAPQRQPLSTWIRGLRTGQIAGTAAVIAVVIFIIQNPHAINTSFLGVHLVLPQAMALLLAALAGALLTAGAGSARITSCGESCASTSASHPPAWAADDRSRHCPADTPQDPRA